MKYWYYYFKLGNTCPYVFTLDFIYYIGIYIVQFIYIFNPFWLKLFIHATLFKHFFKHLIDLSPLNRKSGLCLNCHCCSKVLQSNLTFLWLGMKFESKLFVDVVFANSLYSVHTHPCHLPFLHLTVMNGGTQGSHQAVQKEFLSVLPGFSLHSSIPHFLL